MHRVFLALSLLVACDGASAPESPEPESPEPAPSEADEPVPSEVDEPASAEANEPTDEPEPAYYVAERPDPFFLVDDCDGATGPTAAEALWECRRLARGGRPYLRRMCDCRPAMVLEVKPTDPAAFYRGCCAAPGDTPAAAHAECERRVRDGWCEPEDTRRVDVVSGPYERPGTGGLYEDATVHRYLAWWPTGDHFDWVDESGEPPCFASGTPVATPGGPVPIERIAEGDTVLTYDAGQVVRVPVIRVRRREASRLLALTLDGGTLRVTVEHPIHVGRRWVPARELRVGDELQTREGTTRVRAIAVEEGLRTVHSLRVGTPHTYLAGGVLVHNY